MRDDLAAFLDTNVLVYAVSLDEPDKQKRAREIVARGFAEGCYAVSTQVLLELYVNVTVRTRMHP
jgi:predicted nucleic acid-binding protein